MDYPLMCYSRNPFQSVVWKVAEGVDPGASIFLKNLATKITTQMPQLCGNVRCQILERNMLVSG